MAITLMQRSGQAARISFAQVLIILVAIFLAVLFGLMVALLPPSFSAKVAVLAMVPVLLLVAISSATASRGLNYEGSARALLCIWVFLLGACPAYLPFKFGPLPGLNPLRVTFALVAATWLLSLLSSSAFRARLGERMRCSRMIFWLVTSFLLWQFVSALLGDEPLLSLYYAAKSIVPAYLLFLVSVSLIRGPEDFTRLASALMFGAVAAAVIGLVEWKTQLNPFLYFFDVAGNADDVGALDWILADKSRDGTYRVSASFSHPLLLGEFVSMALPMALTAAFVAGSTARRTAAWACLPLLICAIYLAQTRSALLAAAAGLFVMLFLLGIRAIRQRQSIAAAFAGWMSMGLVGAFAVALAVASFYLAAGASAGEAGSSQARWIMFNRGLHLLSSQPLQGYGPGLAALKFGFLPGARSLTIDSYLISVAIESGFIGLGLWLGLNIAAVAMAVRQYLSAAPGLGIWHLAIAAALVASFVVKLILSLMHNFDLLFVLVGAIVALGLPQSSSAESARVPKALDPRQRFRTPRV